MSVIKSVGLSGKVIVTATGIPVQYLCRDERLQVKMDSGETIISLQHTEEISFSRFWGWVILVLALACVLAYANTFRGGWVWDDASSVLLHKHVRAPRTFFQLFREDQHAFGRGEGNFYRPLVSVSFMADYWLSGAPGVDEQEKIKGPEVPTFPFHLTNMLMHLAAAFLFAVMLYGFGASRFVCVAAPLIFVVHPLHTEAVAYISGRADMMSGAAIFAALYFSYRSIRSERPLIPLLGAALCFVAGLLSKESTLIYPFLLVLTLPVMRDRIAVCDGESNKPSLLRTAAPAIVAAVILAVYIALRATVLRFSEGGEAAGSSLAQRLAEAAQALGLYLKLLFVPTHLHMERVLDDVSGAYILLGVVFLCVMVGAIFFSLRWGNKRIAAACAWFLIAWIPISGVFPLNAPMAEHWMYVPMAGFWWALAEILFIVCRREYAKRLAWAAVTVLCIVFIGMTARRNLDWRDNVTLFRATLRENPESARVHFNLAVTYEDIEGNYAGARRHYERYLDIQSRRRAMAPEGGVTAPQDEIEARMSLGKVLMRLQEYEEAVNVYTPLIGLSKVEGWKQVAAVAACETGKAMLALGEMGRATVCFQQALGMEPGLLSDIENSLSGRPFNELY